MNHFIEIRSLNLKPGTRDEFHRLYIEEALQRWNFDVVAYGPRERILALIESYVDVVLEVDEVTVQGLRK
jgi:hypothetical protein